MNFSKVMAIFLLALFLPVLFIAAILVYISIGKPIFFTQPRRGLNGKLFDIIKFRTMKGGDSKVKSFTHYKLRTTKITRLLRRSKIDEMPQFINVLRGELNFFGPRALLPDSPLGIQNAKYLELRGSIMPGIIGLAQVKNLDHTNARRRLAADILFIKRDSLYLRLVICKLLINRLASFRKEKP